MCLLRGTKCKVLNIFLSTLMLKILECCLVTVVIYVAIEFQFVLSDALLLLMLE